MMLKYRDSVSAFAMYAIKRKNADSSLNSKKLKRKHISAGTKKAAKNNIKCIIQEKVNQISVPANANKATKVLTHNTSTTNTINNTSSKKLNVVPTSKNTKSIQKRIRRKIKKNLALTCDLKDKESKTKLKNSVLTINAGVAKMKQVKQKQPKQTKIRKLAKIVNEQFTCNDSNQSMKTAEENHESPLNVSRSMFEWLIHPLKIEDFFQKNWERTPVHIKRNCSNYYQLLMSTPLIDKILRESHILFTKNLDITSYENGIRKTYNPEGRAVPTVVWDYYMNGCSVRMLNPQTYIPKLHSLNATLQEFFGCFVGANSYLTPPNSQGFAPHYDDIEAFILQVEGKKRWRLYKPRNESEFLPRYSSRNFAESELGQPILDTIVNAGDLLYFPRGTIHQGETIDDTHSLHVTLSVYQKNSWSDFLEKLLPDALHTAIKYDSEFREGLPLDYLRYTGFVHSANQSNLKAEFKEKITNLCSKIIQYINIDKAADIMAKNHVHDFLPPVLSEKEQKCSIVRDGEKMTSNGIVKNRVEIEPDTRIRLIRSHCIRLIKEEGMFRIYYSSENSLEYHEYVPQFVEVTDAFVPAILEIISQYPKFIRVEDLPIDGVDNKIQIVKDLWEKCLVVTDNPLCAIDD